MNLSEQKPKTFWQRPEGVTGTIFSVAIFVAIAYGAYQILPYILTLLTNTIYAIGLLGLLFTIIITLMNENFRNGIGMIFKLAMRKFTGMIIELNPIAIIKMGIQKMKDRRILMNDKMGLVNGQKQKISKKIEENNKKILSAVSTAEYAQTKGAEGEGEVMVQMNQATRLRDSNNRLTPLLKRLDDLYDFLMKLYKASDLIIRDKEAEIEVMESEYIATKEATSAINLVKSVFNGAEDDMYKQAHDYVIDEIGNQLGEIDNFMRSTESMIQSLEYEQGGKTSAGLKMLEEFKSSDFNYLLNRNLGKVPNSPEVIMIPKDKPATGKKGGISGLLD